MSLGHNYTEYCTLVDVGCAAQDCPNAITRKAHAHVTANHEVVTDCCGAQALSEYGDPYTLKDFEVEHTDLKPWLRRVK
jgi:hypothetical protein